MPVVTRTCPECGANIDHLFYRTNGYEWGRYHFPTQDLPHGNWQTEGFEDMDDPEYECGECGAQVSRGHFDLDTTRTTSPPVLEDAVTRPDLFVEPLNRRRNMPTDLVACPLCKRYYETRGDSEEISCVCGYSFVTTTEPIIQV